VGEIDHAHDAEDQRQADAQEGIGPAQDQGIGAVLQELIQRT
jgi:hypothetical protein